MLNSLDRLEITDLVHRYAACIDSGNIAQTAGLFTDDAVLIIPNPPDSYSPAVAFAGRDLINHTLERVLKLDGTFHEVVGHVLDPIDGDADRAIGRTACVAHHFVRGKDDQWHIHYDDIYVRTPEGWRFARRAYTIDSMRVVETRYPKPSPQPPAEKLA
jgi:ketosteroid isomerase-like protein